MDKLTCSYCEREWLYAFETVDGLDIFACDVHRRRAYYRSLYNKMGSLCLT